MSEIHSAYRMPNVVDPATNTVVVDLDCRKCGYNLRTLHENARCPECGSPVGLSTRGNFLQFANPEWVAKVAKGLQIVFWMIIISIFINWGSACLRGVSVVLPVLIAAIVSGIDLFGIWLMTEPDPSGIGEEKNVSARKVVRVASVIAASAAAVQLLIVVGGEFIAGAMGIILIVAGIAAGLAQLIAQIARYNFFAIIARRIPNDQLASRSITLRNGAIICFALLIIGGIIMVFSNDLGLIAMLPGGIGILIVGILTIILIYRMQKQVTAESASATVNWAASEYSAADTGGTAPPPMTNDGFNP